MLNVGARVAHLGWIGLGILAGGLLILGGAIAMLVFRRAPSPRNAIT